MYSAYALDAQGMAAAVSKMAFGNKLGVKIEHDWIPRDFFRTDWAMIWQRFRQISSGEKSVAYTVSVR